MHTFLSNLANRQTNEHGQKHLPPPLSEDTWYFVDWHCVIISMVTY